MSSKMDMSIYVSEQLNRQMVNVIEDVTRRCIMECALKYGFDGEEALVFLNLSTIKIERKKVEKEVKVKVPKAAFPLPYNGEFNDNCCFALRQNNGLYTQCTGKKKGENNFCKSCSTTLQKTGAEIPEYGTIQMRQAVGIFEYVDPKGRKPIAYTKIMKKYNLTEDQVVVEGCKLNITVNPQHFVVAEESVKRGRPSSLKEPKEKGAKGRPKKSNKVLEIEGDEEDLFASLIAQANEEQDVEMEPVAPKKKAGKSDEEKEAEKEAKRLAAEKAKADKEAKLAAAKAEKEAKLAAAKAEKEAKKKAEEEAKAAKKAALKAEKEAAKKAPKASSKKAVVEEQDDEPDVVKKIEFEGKKYLKSKKTGIIYDYTEYTKNGEQVVVGKWNEVSNKIDFNEDEDEDEEEEEEYDK
jgi:hypothetical protein